MVSTRTGERGFTLLELVICVGILALASAAALGGFAALARNARPPAVRDAALAAAENALTRARAAVAYASSPTQDGPPLVADRTWGLRPGATSFVVAAQVRDGASCGAREGALLRLAVTTTYDPPAERFSVTVRYPRDPCASGAPLGDGGGTATVTLSETLPVSAYPPGQLIHHDVPPPARM